MKMFLASVALATLLSASLEPKYQREEELARIRESPALNEYCARHGRPGFPSQRMVLGKITSDQSDNMPGGPYTVPLCMEFVETGWSPRPVGWQRVEWQRVEIVDTPRSNPGPQLFGLKFTEGPLKGKTEAQKPDELSPRDRFVDVARNLLNKRFDGTYLDANHPGCHRTVDSLKMTIMKEKEGACNSCKGDNSGEQEKVDITKFEGNKMFVDFGKVKGYFVAIEGDFSKGIRFIPEGQVDNPAANHWERVAGGKLQSETKTYKLSKAMPYKVHIDNVRFSRG